MKPIRRHRQFEKHFRARIAHNKNLAVKFEDALQLFVGGVRDYSHGKTKPVFFKVMDRRVKNSRDD